MWIEIQQHKLCHVRQMTRSATSGLSEMKHVQSLLPPMVPSFPQGFFHCEVAVWVCRLGTSLSFLKIAAANKTIPPW